MAGYRYGRDLVDRFMVALAPEGGDVLGSLDALVAGEADPRKAEIYADLKDVVCAKVLGVRP